MGGKARGGGALKAEEENEREMDRSGVCVDPCLECFWWKGKGG